MTMLTGLLFKDSYLAYTAIAVCCVEFLIQYIQVCRVVKFKRVLFASHIQTLFTNIWSTSNINYTFGEYSMSVKMSLSIEHHCLLMLYNHKCLFLYYTVGYIVLLILFCFHHNSCLCFNLSIINNNVGYQEIEAIDGLVQIKKKVSNM